MLKHSVIFMMIATSLLILGCKMTPKIDIEAETRLLLDSDKAFAAVSVESGSAFAFKAFLAEDATQFPTKGEPITGRSTIFQSMLEGNDDYTLSWEPQHAEVSACADLGWTWGRWTLTPVDTTVAPSHGYYVNVWKKIDGNWRVLVDVGTKE